MHFLSQNVTNILVHKLFGFAKSIRLFFVFFSFSAPPYSVGEALHVAFKKYKTKKIYFFSVNTKYISSRELKISG